ncbi:MAG: TSUP family transporter [Planctomycetota bacterium]|jgi:uncharacterized membrane protein YfcA
MDYVIVCASALVIALLTLFSGFGLGTLLMPVFAIFFPVEVAVAATAVVHLANNVFKLALVGKHAIKAVVLRFGIPAVVAAFGGAAVLGLIGGLPALAEYDLAGRRCEVTALKLVIAVLIIIFALFDLVPALKKLSVDRKYLPLGGVLSGFFGGLSGHQGALRSAFLVKLGLTSRAFIGTGVTVAVMVDVARLVTYGAGYATWGLASEAGSPRLAGLVAAATFAAFAGSFIASRLLHKVTINLLQTLVGVLLILMALALAAGLI